MSQSYCIRVKGHLDLGWSAWFDGLTITHAPSGESLLTGMVPDQAALYGILEKARNLNLILISVAEVSNDGSPEDSRAAVTVLATNLEGSLWPR